MNQSFGPKNWYPHLLIIILPYTNCKNLCALLCISAYPLDSSHFYNVINAPKKESNAIKTYKQIIFYSLNVAMTYPLIRCSPALKTRGQISSFFPPRCSTQWLVTYPRYQQSDVCIYIYMKIYIHNYTYNNYIFICIIKKYISLVPRIISSHLVPWISRAITGQWLDNHIFKGPISNNRKFLALFPYCFSSAHTHIH